MFRKFNLKTEIILAVMPATMIISVLMLLEIFTSQKLLFSSLASSAFLIYMDPKHPTNRVRTLIIAQISAALIGYLIFILLGPGYLSAAISMINAIIVMISAKAMHPPAVSSAMIFAFQYTKPNTLMLFMMAVLLLVMLIVLQKLSLWVLKKADKENVAEEI